MRCPIPLAAAIALTAQFASAQVYRCTTPSGGVEYSQIPCGKDAVQLQSRKNSIDTGPPGDPFGVQRERDRLAAETEMNMQKLLTGSAGNRQPVATPTARPIDPAACERADREAKIEAGHARKDADRIKRAQQLADFACGRDIRKDEAAPAAKKNPTLIPGSTRAPNPVIASCDQAGCWDTAGNRYNRAAGNTFFGPNGVACTSTGGLVCP